MMRLLTVFCLMLFFQPVFALSEAENIFLISEKAPAVIRAHVKSTRSPAGADRFYLYELEVRETLSSEKLPERVKVLQEVLFANEGKFYPESGEFIAALRELPSYSVFTKARQEGVGYLGLGKAVSVQYAELLKRWVGASETIKKQGILLEALGLGSPINNDAALALGKSALSGFLTAEAMGKIETALPSLSPQAQQVLVRALSTSGGPSAVAALQRIANGAPSPAKWAAIQALEKLGVARSLEELKADFSQASEADKPRLVSALVARQDETSRGFLTSLLAGSESINVKREVLEQMAAKGTVYESLLIEQTRQKDEQVAMQAVAVLGGMSGDKAFERIVELLDSPSAKLRGAAGMALLRSPDPRAAKIYHEKFEERGYGHFH